MWVSDYPKPVDVVFRASKSRARNMATPLYSATTAATQDKLYSSDILEALLKAKAPTPRRHLKVIEQLLRHGALPSARDPEKRTPLHIEFFLKSLEGQRRRSDRMPLHYAFVKKVTSLCAVEGVRVDVPDEFGATPLLCAARRGATISSLYLSKRGASLKARDKSGNDTLGVALAGHLQRETVQGKTKIVPGPPLSLFREADEYLEVLGRIFQATSHKQLGLSYLLLDHGYPFHGAIQDSLELGEFRLVLTLLSKINPSENAVVQRLDRDKNRRSLHHALAGFPRRLGPEATEIAEDSSAASQLDEEGFLQRFPDRDHLVFMDMLLPLNKDPSTSTS
ncbi:hypothetical protein AK812_SmicGene8478 [Symbiodinium microadriaticum]|uniref:Uncharacterized protein n=1 Tax=Symbiodinium microadriaticum TaxID=2951 RepID=A0A1Q9EKT8_SYMMI|nr:hypothetical protein AK812_SmicGene8478 [Symbiodinium microadriaticum]